MTPQELANRIETIALNPQAPAFPDLIEANWKMIVRALRALAEAEEQGRQQRAPVKTFGQRLMDEHATEDETR